MLPLIAPLTDDIWKVSPPARVEGDSLKTFEVSGHERVQLSIRTTGRPLEANVEVWHTPSYTPTRFKVSCEDGSEHPFHTLIETPRQTTTIAVFNDEGGEFPIEASVASAGLGTAYESLAGVAPELVQGGKVTSHTFGPEVACVHVLLMTEQRDMKALIENLSGPNDDNQIIEVDATRGHENPFYTVLPTPGDRVVTIRIVNEGTVEFPFDAYLLPCVGEASDEDYPAVEMGRW